jgi:hypothetical protein
LRYVISNIEPPTFCLVNLQEIAGRHGELRQVCCKVGEVDVWKAHRSALSVEVEVVAPAVHIRVDFVLISFWASEILTKLNIIKRFFTKKKFILV